MGRRNPPSADPAGQVKQRGDQEALQEDDGQQHQQRGEIQTAEDHGHPASGPSPGPVR